MIPETYTLLDIADILGSAPSTPYKYCKRYIDYFQPYQINGTAKHFSFQGLILFRAKKNIEILEEQLENSVKLQEIVKLQFESASATIAQLLSVNEAIAKNRLELLRAKSTVKLAELRLKQEVGYSYQ